MAYSYQNITGSTAVEIIGKRRVFDEATQVLTKQDYGKNIKSMKLANVHATDSVSVNLYVYDATLGTFYILKNLVIPFGVTLELDSEDMKYDDELYSLYLKLSASGSAVDIIIN